MRNKHNLRLALAICLLLMCIERCIYIYTHNYEARNKQVGDLESQVLFLRNELKYLSNLDEFAWDCQDNIEGFNYLAIGNSITIHAVSDYWWTESGMAASSVDKDYFHIVCDYMKEKTNVVSCALNFATWETQKNDRAETLSILDSYLNPALDLITVQLGENVDDLSTYESDFSYLLGYLRQGAPGAQILVIGDFWNKEGRDHSKKTAAQIHDAVYIDLDRIKDKPDYMAGIGYTVTDTEGEMHIVEHSGVARHPNDSAMNYIAERILSEITVQKH